MAVSNNLLARLGIDIVINSRRSAFALNDIHRSLINTTSGVQKLGVGFSILTVAAGSILVITRFMTGLAEAIKSVVLEAAKYEKLLIDIEKIAKTGNLVQLKHDFDELNKSFALISRTDISETFQEVARSGLALDEGLTKLTREALTLQQIAGDLGTKEAAIGLSALLQNTDATIDSIGKLSSGIDLLSDNFLTSTGEILKTSARLSGFADAANLSAEEVNALSASLLASRQSPTVVRSTITALFTSLTEDPKRAAEALKLSTNEMIRFNAAISASPMEALKQFVQHLKNLTPQDQAKALREMGLASHRTASTIKILQNGVENLDKALVLSQFHDGTNKIDKLALVSGQSMAAIESMTKAIEQLKTELGEDFKNSISIAIGALELFENALREVNILKAKLTPQQEQKRLEDAAAGIIPQEPGAFGIRNLLFQNVSRDLGDTVAELDAQKAQLKENIKKLKETLKNEMDQINWYEWMDAAELSTVATAVLGEVKKLETVFDLIAEKRAALVDEAGNPIQFMNIAQAKQQINSFALPPNVAASIQAELDEYQIAVNLDPKLDPKVAPKQLQEMIEKHTDKIAAEIKVKLDFDKEQQALSDDLKLKLDFELLTDPVDIEIAKLNAHLEDLRAQCMLVQQPSAALVATFRQLEAQYAQQEIDIRNNAALEKQAELQKQQADAQRRSQEARDDRLSSLSGQAGVFGGLIDDVLELRKLLADPLNQDPALQKALMDLGANLFKTTQQNQTQFLSFDDAFRKNITAVGPTDIELLQQQLEVAKAMLTSTNLTQKQQADLIKVMEKIAKEIEEGNKL